MDGWTWVEVAPGRKRLVRKSSLRRKRRPFLSIAPPPFPKGHSVPHGRRLTSWSEYHAANKELDLVDVGHPPNDPVDTSIKYTGKRGVVVDREGKPVTE